MNIELDETEVSYLLLGLSQLVGVGEVKDSLDKLKSKLLSGGCPDYGAIPQRHRAIRSFVAVGSHYPKEKESG